MSWIDISIALRPGTPEWPGDTRYDCQWAWAIGNGASVNVSSISTSPHNGTHADAPLHVREGAAGSHLLPVDAFVGPAWVCDVRLNRGELTIQDLALPDAPVARVLLRTGGSVAAGAFPEEWPALSVAAATALTQRGVQLVGVDCPSVDERHSKSLAVHHALFDGGAQILENLDLSQAPAGAYDLMALPLRLFGLDAAPVRALLRPHA